MKEIHPGVWVAEDDPIQEIIDEKKEEGSAKQRESSE